MNDKWEYKVLHIQSHKSGFTRLELIELELNRMGQEGWEAIFRTFYPSTASDVYEFKRKIS